MPELVVAIGIYSVLAVVLYSVLQMVTRAWYRSSARDDALRQLRNAKARLVRDLANSSQRTGQFGVSPVPAHLSGYDGDALTFLSSDDGTNEPRWSVNATAQCEPAAQITYYLVIPDPSLSSAGPADAAGYEQQCPYKWLIRRVDSSLPTPTPPNDFAVNPAWTSWLTAPTGGSWPAGHEIVAEQMFQFRVLSSPPLWTVQMSAVAVEDARRQLAVGRVSLVGTKFTVSQQVSVPAQN